MIKYEHDKQCKLINKLRNISLKTVKFTDSGVKLIANKTKYELMNEFNKNINNIHFKACILGIQSIIIII